MGTVNRFIRISLSVFTVWMMSYVCLPSVAWASGAVRKDYDPNDYVLVMADIVAQPDPNAPRDAGPPEIGRLAGSPGKGSVLVTIDKNKLPNPTNYYAITGITVIERSNNPCKMYLGGKMVDPRYASNTRVLAEYEIGKCKGKKKDGRDGKMVSFPSTQHRFIRAVRVCGGNVKKPIGLPHEAYVSEAWEIKGMMIKPAQVTVADSVALKANVTSWPDLKVFNQPNCKKKQEKAMDISPGWGGWSECPEGQLLTGVRVHHNKGKKAFTGLKMQCQSVMARKISGQTPKPKKDNDGY